MKAINWLEEVGDFNVKASASIQDMNTKHTAQTPCFTLNLLSLLQLSLDYSLTLLK